MQEVSSLPRQGAAGEQGASFKPLALLVGSAFFMEQLDSTIIAPAIPAMARDFAVEPLSLNLAMTLYLLFLVICVPASGAFADRFGTRKVFCAAVTIFSLGSIACGLASDLQGLLIARSVQGIGAALMVPVGRMAMVRATHPRELIAAMAWMVTPAMLGPLLGPPVGGLIVTWLSWPWIFWVNVPIGVLGVYLAWRIVPDFLVSEPRPLDWPGWLIVSMGAGALVVGLDLSRDPTTDTAIAPLLLGLSALCVPAYWAHARRRAHPVLDFSLMGITTFRVALVSGSLVRVGYGALPFLLPLTLQLGVGLSPIDSGVVMAGSALASMLLKTVTVKILRRFGFRHVLIVNGTLCAVGLGLCALLGPDWGLFAILMMLLVSGISRSIQFNALGSMAYAETPREQTGPATSLNTTFQQLAAALGIGLSAWMLDAFAAWAGEATPTLHSYALTYLVLAVIALFAVPICFQLHRDAGQGLSGR